MKKGEIVVAGITAILLIAIIVFLYRENKKITEQSIKRINKKLTNDQTKSLILCVGQMNIAQTINLTEDTKCEENIMKIEQQLKNVEEDALKNNNELSEDTRREFDQIHDLIGNLLNDKELPERRRIGFIQPDMQNDNLKK